MDPSNTDPNTVRRYRYSTRYGTVPSGTVTDNNIRRMKRSFTNNVKICQLRQKMYLCPSIGTILRDSSIKP